MLPAIAIDSDLAADVRFEARYGQRIWRHIAPLHLALAGTFNPTVRPGKPAASK
jgi:hypothetical protein